MIFLDFVPEKLEGGCAYGEYGRTINDGDVALVASSKLYKGGASCGACYKVFLNCSYKDSLVRYRF